MATFAWSIMPDEAPGPDGKPRYVIYNDSIHEGSGADFNPIVSLGMVKTLFKNIIPMSEALGVDAAYRAKVAANLLRGFYEETKHQAQPRLKALHAATVQPAGGA